MNIETLDYRNGKYQGNLDPAGRRHGLGIFIDDDLTFYASHWNNNKLHGQTLLYISHGKYIYGEWKKNQLSGLAVFRSGDTVLVGQFKNNFPVGRCMLIFQKFNFVCILEEGQSNDQWNVIDSGTIRTHKMLQQYIQKIGVSVPDHYFSLTKFICNFALTNSSLKTFPCYVGCCYFGFVDGLGMIFNCNNGLVTIGKHTNEDVTEFGGKFKNSRSGSEGNFQFGGERVNYTGQRPAHQIYPIFQKLHKQSLNFVNQYFDSKIKCFTNVETFLRSQLKNITEDCKQKYSFSAELNDSLDYQEYNQEESIKLNENRDSLYDHPPQQSLKKDSVNSTPKKNSASLIATPKQVKGKMEQSDQNMRFFRKSSIKPLDDKRPSPLTIKENEPKTPSNLSSDPQVYMAKKSPIRPTKQERSRKPSQDHVSPFVVKKDSRVTGNQQQKQYQSKEVKKEKTRPNNHRYLMNYGEQDNSAPVVKNNQVYRETPKKEESPQSFKLPTFKALGEDIDQKKINKYQVNQPLSKNSLIKENLEAQSIQSSTKKRSDIYRPATPSYEDIEERRKRILKSFQQGSQQCQPQKQTTDGNGLGQYQSPFNGAVFSLPKEEEIQKGPGFMPLSLYNKDQRASPFKMRQQIKRTCYTGQQKENSRMKTPYQIAEQLSSQKKSFKKQPEYENKYYEFNNVVPEFVKMSKAEETQQFTPFRQVTLPRESPKRQRKCYQYLYE